MVKRKGELSQKTIDREWPHQVAVTAETCRGHGYVTTHYFCERLLSLCPRHWFFRRDDRDYVVFCFAEADHAELFRARFNGEVVSPKKRRREA